MKKLFHEVALQPEALMRSDASVLLRELRLDHERYVENIPLDWLQEASRILEADTDPNKHKKLALMAQLRSSVISTRSHRELGRSRTKHWAEMIAFANRARPFDVVVLEKELQAQNQKIDLDDYIEGSRKELGFVSRTFRTPAEWLDVIKPVIRSDNMLAIVDRYLDLSDPHYSKLFEELLEWIADSKIAQLRIFIGPKNASEVRDSSWRKRFESVSQDIIKMMKARCPRSSIRVLVSCCKDLHLRYLGTKVCGVELDYGFRLSGDRPFKLSVLREAALQDFRMEFLSAIGGTKFLANKSVWPTGG